MSVRNYTREGRGRKLRPFADAALDYRNSGWPGVIPVARRGDKAPLLAGCTGRAGIDLDGPALALAVIRYGTTNVGLRLPWSVVGIDVDGYDGRAGADTLALLSGRLGPLPETWRSTSRALDDPVSGIYLFHAPRRPDWGWVSNLGEDSGIEIVQTHHRFVTAPPSVHNSTGRVYGWWRGLIRAEVPRPADLPMLPVAWARYLMSSVLYGSRPVADDAAAAKWYDAVANGPPCDHMRDAARRGAADIRAADASGGLHDAMTRVTTYLCRCAAEGHRGLGAALGEAEREFTASSRRRGLRGEWERAVAGARAAAAAREQIDDDPCDELRGPWRTRREAEK